MLKIVKTNLFIFIVRHLLSQLAKSTILHRILNFLSISFLFFKRNIGVSFIFCAHFSVFISLHQNDTYIVSGVYHIVIVNWWPYGYGHADACYAVRLLYVCIMRQFYTIFFRSFFSFSSLLFCIWLTVDFDNFSIRLEFSTLQSHASNCIHKIHIIRIKKITKIHDLPRHNKTD